MHQPWLHSGMRVKMEQIHELLMQLPPSSSVSITRPDELAKELFTIAARARWCAAASGC
jgi:acetylglutamate kinase